MPASCDCMNFHDQATFEQPNLLFVENLQMNHLLPILTWSLSKVCVVKQQKLKQLNQHFTFQLLILMSQKKQRDRILLLLLIGEMFSLELLFNFGIFPFIISATISRQSTFRSSWICFDHRNSNNHKSRATRKLKFHDFTELNTIRNRSDIELFSHAWK